MVIVVVPPMTPSTEAYLLELSLFEPLPVRALPPLPPVSFRLIPFCPRGVERYYHVLLEAECGRPGWFSLIGPPEEVEAVRMLRTLLLGLVVLSIRLRFTPPCYR